MCHKSKQLFCFFPNWCSWMACYTLRYSKSSQTLNYFNLHVMRRLNAGRCYISPAPHSWLPGPAAATHSPVVAPQKRHQAGSEHPPGSLQKESSQSTWEQHWHVCSQAAPFKVDGASRSGASSQPAASAGPANWAQSDRCTARCLFFSLRLSADHRSRFNMLCKPFLIYNYLLYRPTNAAVIKGYCGDHTWAITATV